MVATISPAADSYEETLSTLRYADRLDQSAANPVQLAGGFNATKLVIMYTPLPCDSGFLESK